jgi:hypothetical protein
MKEVDFLRYLLDYIDNRIDQKVNSKSNSLCSDDCVDRSIEIVNTDNSIDPSTVDSPIDDDKRFIPPLQANIEIMKKLAGVPPKDETLKQSQIQGGPAGGTNSITPSLSTKLLGALHNDVLPR